MSIALRRFVCLITIYNKNKKSGRSFEQSAVLPSFFHGNSWYFIASIFLLSSPLQPCQRALPTAQQPIKSLTSRNRLAIVPTGGHDALLFLEPAHLSSTVNTQTKASWMYAIVTCFDPSTFLMKYVGSTTHPWLVGRLLCEHMWRRNDRLNS